jgi:hypothetical protein
MDYMIVVLGVIALLILVTGGLLVAFRSFLKAHNPSAIEQPAAAAATPVGMPRGAAVRRDPIGRAA